MEGLLDVPALCSYLVSSKSLIKLPVICSYTWEEMAELSCISEAAKKLKGIRDGFELW